MNGITVSMNEYVLNNIASFVRFGSDVSWSETGDRYLLKLFRDYLFHQVTPSGAPWIDLAHVVLTLNKVVTFEYLTVVISDTQCLVKFLSIKFIA